MPEAPPILERRSARRVAAATLAVAGVAVAFLVLYVLRWTLFLLFIGIVLAIALRPLVARAERHSGSRLVAVAFVYCVLLVLLGGVAALAVPLLIEQAGSILALLPETYEEFRESIRDSPNDFLRRLARELPHEVAVPEGEIAENALGTLAWTLGYLPEVVRGVFAVFAVVLVSFYWSVLEERTVRWLLLLVPMPRREAARGLFDAMQSKVGDYLRGQGILCLIMGVLTAAAYALIGLPYWFGLGVLAGILEAVPVFGPIMAAVPAVLIALSLEPGKVVWVLVATVVLQQAENSFLVPRVMDRSVGVNPVVTLLALAAFGTLLGWMGAVLAIPLAAILQLALDRTLLSPEAMRPSEPEGRDQTSVLRYEAEELETDVRLHLRDKATAPSPGADRIEETIESIARDLHQELTEASDEETPP